MQTKQDLPHRIFAYGTLKTGQPNHFHLSDTTHGRCRYLGPAISDKPFPLVIATKWNVPFLLHVPNVGQRIRGEIYAVDDDMMKWMDEFEGHPDVYYREKIQVQLTNSQPNTESKPNNSVETLPFKEKLLIEEPSNDVTKKDHLRLNNTTANSEYPKKETNNSATYFLNETNKHLSAKESTRPEGTTGSRDLGTGNKVLKENKLPNRTTPEVPSGQTVDCWCYFLQDYPQGLLQETMYASYESKGDQEKHFVDDEDLKEKGIENIRLELERFKTPAPLMAPHSKSSPTLTAVDS